VSIGDRSAINNLKHERSPRTRKAVSIGSREARDISPRVVKCEACGCLSPKNIPPPAELLFQIGPAPVIGDQGAAEILRNRLAGTGHLCKTAQRDLRVHPIAVFVNEICRQCRVIETDHRDVPRSFPPRGPARRLGKIDFELSMEKRQWFAVWTWFEPKHM
jgi:hypothetical protein